MHPEKQKAVNLELKTLLREVRMFRKKYPDIYSVHATVNKCGFRNSLTHEYRRMIRRNIMTNEQYIIWQRRTMLMRLRHKYGI